MQIKSYLLSLMVCLVLLFSACSQTKFSRRMVRVKTHKIAQEKVEKKNVKAVKKETAHFSALADDQKATKERSTENIDLTCHSLEIIENEVNKTDTAKVYFSITNYKQNNTVYSHLNSTMNKTKPSKISKFNTAKQALRLIRNKDIKDISDLGLIPSILLVILILIVLSLLLSLLPGIISWILSIVILTVLILWLLQML